MVFEQAALGQTGAKNHDIDWGRKIIGRVKRARRQGDRCAVGEQDRVSISTGIVTSSL
jgi:hypothetical protein